MKRTVACSSLWLLTCGCTPVVEREPSTEIVAEAAPRPDPPARPAAPPPATAGADEPDDTTSAAFKDMSEETVLHSPARRPPCGEWLSDWKELCACLERHHRGSLGAAQAGCGLLTHSRLARMHLNAAEVESGEPGGAVCYLVERRRPSGFAVIFAGSAVDSTNDCDWPGGYGRVLADGGELLSVRYEWTSRHVQKGPCTTTTTTTTTDELLCVREPGSTSPAVCGLTVPVKREAVTRVACDDRKTSRTSRQSVRFDLDFRLDGFVTTRLAEGDRRWLKGTPDEVWLTPRTLPVRGPKP
jgi:hypothetical protein